jgi:hypothetical protein
LLLRQKLCHCENADKLKQKMPAYDKLAFFCII